MYFNLYSHPPTYVLLHTNSNYSSCTCPGYRSPSIVWNLKASSKMDYKIDSTFMFYVHPLNRWSRLVQELELDMLWVLIE